MTQTQSLRTGVALREPIPWHELVLATETIERAGYETLFVPEIAGREAFATLAGLARVTIGLRLAPGVLAIDSRSPELIAMGAATLNELSQGRFVLGIGAGEPRPGSVGRMREAVAFLKGALAGETVKSGGGSSFRLSLDPGEHRVPLWIAALGPRTMRLAGEVADGVLLNWCTPERVAFAREQVRDGARAAGRDPDEITVAVYVRACVGQEEPAALDVLKAAAAAYASEPAYGKQFEAMGLGPEAAAAAAALQAGGVQDVPEALVRAVCLLGDANAARARMAEYRRAGADMPVVYPVPALDPVSSIVGTILAMAPSPAVER